MIANLLPLRVCEIGPSIREIPRTAVLVLGDFEFGKLLRMGQRQHPKSNSIKQFKDRRIGADAQCQRDGGNGEKSGADSEQAAAIAKILPQALQPAEWFHLQFRS